MGSGAECSKMRSWRWKCEMDWSPPLRARRLIRLGPKMTTHAIMMMITSTTGTNSSTTTATTNGSDVEFPSGGWSAT